MKCSALSLMLLLTALCCRAEFLDLRYPRNEADVGEKAVVYVPPRSAKIQLDGKLEEQEWQGAYRHTESETVSEVPTELIFAGRRAHACPHHHWARPCSLPKVSAGPAPCRFI